MAQRLQSGLGMKLSLAGYRVLSLALPLVPAFFVMEHVGPEGFPEAQGCSGGANVAPPQRLTIHSGESAEPVPVATDSFFLMDHQFFAAVDPSNISVVVTTLEGDVVEGSVRIVGSQVGLPRFSWSASTPVPLGTKLKASVHAVGFPASDEAMLEVVGPPAELSAGQLSVASWFELGHGVGPDVSCETTTPVYCSYSLILPGAEEVLHAARYTWTPPADINGFVAWHVSVDRSVEATSELTQPVPASYTGPSASALELGQLAFPMGSQQYCAKVTVTDLRTEDSVTTELCGQPGDSTGLERDYPLDLCSKPPSAALTEAWCKSHPSSTLAECKPLETDDDGFVPGSVGPGNPPADADASRSRSSSGCTMSPGASGVASRASCFGLFVAVTALFGALRRRRSAR